MNITESVTCNALRLPVHYTYDELSNDNDVRSMLSSLGYSGPLDNMSRLKRSFLRKK